MPLILKAKRTPLSTIDLEDRTFSLDPCDQIHVPEQLITSIERVGIMHPPIIREKKPHSFQIVTGKKRLLIAREKLRLTVCECLLCGPETSQADAFCLALEDILLARPLNPVERAIFFKKVLYYTTPEEASRKFLPQLGYSAHPYHIQRLLSLLALEEPILLSLHLGELHESTAYELLDLPFAERLALYDIIKTLALGFGKQRQLIEACKDLATRNSTSIHGLLSDPKVLEIINHPEANVPQKATNLLGLLELLRHPRYGAARETFKKIEGGLGLPKGVTLSHPLSFEDDSLTLSISFRNRGELSSTLDTIKPCIHRLPD